MKKTINLTALAKRYGGGYVARLADTTKVIAHAKETDKLLKKIKDRKEFQENKVVISWIPKYGARYVFKISLRLRKS